MAFDEGLVDRVRTILHARRVTRAALLEKRMFGALVFMVNGNMCCGVRGTELMLRLSGEGAAKALRKPHTRLVDETGKRMKTLIFINERGTDLDHELEAWLDVALQFNSTMQPKAPSATARQRTPTALHRDESRRGTRKRVRHEA